MSLFLNHSYHFSSNNILNLKANSDPVELVMAFDENSNDFIPFEITGTYYSYSETNNLNLLQYSMGSATYDATTTYNLTNISTDIISTLGYDATLYAYGEPAPTFNISCWISYTDGSTSMAFTKTSGLTYGTDYIGNISLTTGKIIDNISLRVYMNTAIGFYARGNIKNIYFYGYLPTIENITYNENFKAGESTVFSADISHISDSLNQNITFQYMETLNLNEQILDTDWIGDNKYYKEVAFSTTGAYRFIISARTEWNTTQSSFYMFYVGDYPQSSYLSLFSNLDGFPLDSKDFKIYVGENEEQSLVDFRGFHGNWSQLYAGSVNASLIDNYIKIQGENDGLSTTFEDGAIHDTLQYNTLLFEMKVLAATRVVVIYNPAYHEKDYYIDFNSSMANYWYAIEIPFFLFNQYQNITNDWLSELGFWVKNTTMEISNIRIATHYNKTYLQQVAIQINMTDSNITSDLDSQNYLNTTTLTFNSTEYGLNSSLNITNGFNCSGASWENVTIDSNSSITLNNSGCYKGNYTWADYANEVSDWSFDVGSGSTYGYEAIKTTHNEMLYLESGGSLSWLRASLDTGAQTNYTLECWIYIIDTTSSTEFRFTDGGSVRTNFRFYLDDLQVSSGGWQILTSVTDNCWHHLIVNVDSVNDSISITHNGTKYKEFAFNTATTDLDAFDIGTRDYTGSGLCYIDSVSMDFDDGYYVNLTNDLIDHNGFYLSDVVDFNSSVEISNITVNSTLQTNNTLDVYVSDNSTGSFDNWLNYSDYIGNSTQYLKYKVLLNNSNSSDLPIFSNINFTFISSVYNLSQTFNITYFTESYQVIWNSTNFFSLKTNDSTGSFNLSIYKFNESQYFNRSFNNTSYEQLNFTLENNTIYDPGNNNAHLFKISGNSSNPFNISINLMNFTTLYNKTLYFGEYNASLLEDFENLYYYYYNNNSLDLDFCLYNGSDYFKQEDLDNSSQWEKYNQTVNDTWTYLKFNFSSFSNQSFWIRELFEIKEESYRLVSLENRQNPDAMQFDFEEETLAILDYFNNTLYRETYNYTAFIDVALPITTISFHNYYADSILIEITRGLGTTIEVLVPPESSISLRIFTTSYLLHVRNLNLQTLLLTEFSPDSSENVVFEFGEQQTATFPTTDWLQNILIFIIISLLALIIGLNIYYGIKNKIKKRKRRKKSNYKGVIF